ncbi:MAG: manganese efflux pump MntP family protein [Cypionkella sp.]
MLALAILALGLAMDAVAVAVARGAAGEPGARRALEVGAAFGIAQGLMPLVGWGLGVALAGAIAAFDHWIAFALLTVLGLRMIREALRGPDAGGGSAASHYGGLAAASVATSVDAAAAGIALPLLGQPIALACLIIGGTTGVLCVVAYGLGGRAGARIGARAELLGGLVLIALGGKILVEHLGAG